MNSRVNILARIKAAQILRGEIEENIPDFTSEIYNKLDKNLLAEFKKNLELVSGKVFICNSKKEISQILSELLLENNQNKIFCREPELQSFLPVNSELIFEEIDFDNLSIAVTNCEFLVAHLGSVIISSAQTGGRRLNVFPEIHVIVAKTSQICAFLEDGLEKIRNKYKNKLPSLISNITGPSRTADIEKTLVMGMHGPKKLVVIIYSDIT